MLILFLAFLFIALYSVARILLPEMNKPLLLKTILESNSLGFDQSNESDNRMTKLETLLTEKSKNIQLLQTELRISHVQIRDFDKVKVLLEEEIKDLANDEYSHEDLQENSKQIGEKDSSQNGIGSGRGSDSIDSSPHGIDRAAASQHR